MFNLLLFCHILKEIPIYICCYPTIMCVHLDWFVFSKIQERSFGDIILMGVADFFLIIGWNPLNVICIYRWCPDDTMWPQYDYGAKSNADKGETMVTAKDQSGFTLLDLFHCCTSASHIPLLNFNVCLQGFSPCTSTALNLASCKSIW